eukprot:gene2742-biopygen23083
MGELALESREGGLLLTHSLALSSGRGGEAGRERVGERKRWGIGGTMMAGSGAASSGPRTPGARALVPRGVVHRPTPPLVRRSQRSEQFCGLWDERHTGEAWSWPGRPPPSPAATP